MSNLVDLVTGYQEAAFAAVTAAMPTDGPTVYTTVPQDPGAFYVQVGSAIGSEDASEGQGDQLEELTLECTFTYLGNDRRKLTAAMHTVRQALDKQRLEWPGASFDATRWVQGQIATASSNGNVHAGVQAYQAFAQAA